MTSALRGRTYTLAVGGETTWTLVTTARHYGLGLCLMRTPDGRGTVIGRREAKAILGFWRRLRVLPEGEGCTLSWTTQRRGGQA